MLSITAEIYGRSADAEIIIQAAMKVETIRLVSGDVSAVTAATQRGHLSASYFLRTNVRKLQM